MKKILEFECPGDEESFQIHVNGPKYHNVIWEVLHTKLRPICKHGVVPEGYESEEVIRFAEELRGYIYELLNEERSGSDL